MIIITKVFKNFATVTFILFCMVFCFANVKDMSKQVICVLYRCVTQLIPCIFPFMVLSSIALESGASIVKGKKFNKINILIFSFLSGFIVGPKLISREGQGKDITGTVGLTSNAGVGFVVSYVGALLWNSILFGVMLYFFQIITALILFFLRKNKMSDISISKKPLLSSVVSSVQGCTFTMLEICGFTVFFTVLKEIFISVFSLNGSILSMIVSSLFEISTGATSSVSIANIDLAAFFTGFSVGFGGICMCFQTFCVCNDATIRKTEFLLIKIFQGILCGIFSFVSVRLLRLNPVTASYAVFETTAKPINVVIVGIFIAFSIIFIKKAAKKKFIRK